MESQSTMDMAEPDAGMEQPHPFIPTPERVSQFLENIKADEVKVKLQSEAGRQQLFDSLMEHEEALREAHPDFDPSNLKEQLDIAGEALKAEQEYLKDVRSPEKRSVFKRAWESVKSFPRKHPIVTALLAAALVAGGLYAAWYYLGGAIVVPNVGDAAGDVTNVLVPPTGGDFGPIPQGDIPLPNPMPGPTGVPDLPMPQPPTGGAGDFFPPGGLH